MPARSGYLLPDHLSTLELREKRGIALRQLAVNAEAHVGPAADPLAVVQVRMHGRAVARVRLVVAAGAVVKDAELVLHLARAIDRDRHANVVLGEEFDDLRLEERRVGRQAE